MTGNIFKRGALCAAAISVAVAGAVTAGADETPTEPSEFRAPTFTPADAVEYAQSRRFAELRRGRTDSDAMPEEWRERLPSMDGAARWGFNPDMARRVGPGVWLMPGRGFVCIANIGPRDGSLGVGCATPADIEEGLLQPSDVNAAGEGVLTGVMADGVESVTLVDKDGSQREVAVERNHYRAPIDADIEEVRWTDAAGIERARNMEW